MVSGDCVSYGGCVRKSDIDGFIKGRNHWGGGGGQCHQNVVGFSESLSSGE